MRNRIITALFIAVAVFAAGAGDINQRPMWPSSVYGSMLVDAVTPFELTGGLVGWWQLDDGSGSTAADASGDGNNGTLINMEGGDWVAGLNGNGSALDFDGTDERVETGAWQPSAADITLSAWIKIAAQPSTSTYWVILSRYDTTSKRSYYLDYRHGGGTEQIGWVFDELGTFTSGSRTYGIYDITLSLDSWHHIAIAFDATTGAAQLYLNGSAVGSDSESTANGLYSPSGTEAAIGCSYTSGTATRLFNGIIDDSRIYNRVLSASEVASMAAGN